MVKRYIHKWNVPIVVVVNEVAEYFYSTPHYNPRLLPVVRTEK